MPPPRTAPWAQRCLPRSRTRTIVPSLARPLKSFRAKCSPVPMCDLQITRLRAEIARARAEGDEEERELLLAKVELNHCLLVKAAREEVQAKLEGLAEAMKQVVEAMRNKEREEHALEDYLASQARARIKRAQELEDAAAPGTKTKRKRASD